MYALMLAIATVSGVVYTGDSNVYNCYFPNSVAVGGATTATYLGFQNQVQADKVVVMIGTNDAFQGTDFYKNYPVILERYRQSNTSVVLCTIMPVLGHPTQENTIEGYNNYIQHLGYPVIDVWTDIQAQPGWQGFYDAGGVHLWNGVQGYDWLRHELESSDTIYLPEPSTLILILLGGLICLRF